VPTIPFFPRRRSPGNAAQKPEVTARLREADGTAWSTIAGPAVPAALRSAWPRHASRAAVLLGRNIDPGAMDILRAVRRALGISAVERADGSCHAPAGSVIAAALKYELVPGSDLAQADCIVCLGDPAANDAALTADLLTARALGVPVIALGVDGLGVATTSLSMPRQQIGPFLQATTKALLAEGWIDRSFIMQQTVGFDAFLADLESDPGPAEHRDDEDLSETLRAFVDLVRNTERLAVVWRPTTAAADALVARAAAGLLLVRGSVAQPGAGLCLVGPISAPHPSECCVVRSSGLNTGLGSMPQPMGVLERAQLGDLEVLVTIGDEPFVGVDRALEQEALQDIDVLIHVGTQGSDALPVHGTQTIVLPGPSRERLIDLVVAISGEKLADSAVDVRSAGPQDREYAFVARAVVEPRRAS